MLLGCGLRNAELRSVRLCDLCFGDESESSVTIYSGKGDKYRRIPFPAPVQQAVREYLESGVRPPLLPDTAPLFGVGVTEKDWHMLNGENLSFMVPWYIEAATRHKGVRSHACRHRF